MNVSSAAERKPAGRGGGTRRRRGLAALLSLSLVLVAAPGAAAPSVPAGTAPTPQHQSVTLITGERVTVTTFPDGRVGYGIIRLDGVPNGDVVQLTRNGDRYVIPAYVLASGDDTLDLELFNVTELLAQGFDDTSAETLPTIVEFTRAPREVESLDRTRTYRLLPAAAAEQPRDEAEDLGRALAEHVDDPTAADPLAGVERIWLDGRVEKALDVSVPQIGAPAAWEAGFDGTGVKVAVLDTGVDADHPDLAGKVVAEANFTEAATADDIDGHGTHVAATIAGSGAASGGVHRGVAPGAEILNGKVLDDFGGGTESSVLAGMEWAVAQGADVINMSLGAGPTDGTDPLSMAVNELTESSGALFVIAAGNSGPESVSSPGTADLALTVGAVDDNDQLADFSSTGPRFGDFAIKPEITAPGVDINAAAAGGSGYVEISGTSMAAPHVAGAAAILAQANPEWAAGELKAALVSSAQPNPDLTVYQQGGGRVDVPAALAVEVLAAPAVLDLGYFPYPQVEAEPATRSVTYTNTTDADTELNLEVALTAQDGSPAPEGAVSLSTQMLTLPPGGTATVDVTVDPASGEPALYGGFITATSADGDVVRTPVGYYKEPVRHTLTLTGIDRDGDPGFGEQGVFLVANVETGEAFADFVFLSEADGASVDVRVPPGTYSVIGFSAGEAWVAELAELEVVVDTDSTVVLDARDALPVEVMVPHPRATQRHLSLLSALTTADGASYENVYAAGEDVAVFAEPTEEATIGSLVHVVQGIYDAGPRRLWDVMFVEQGRIPADLTFEVGPHNTATVTETFHAHVPGTTYLGLRYGFVPGLDGAYAIDEVVSAPTRRTAVLSAGNGVEWNQEWMHLDPENYTIYQGYLTDEPKAYEPGERVRSSWYKQVSNPTPNGSVRSEDTLVTLIPEFGDGAGNIGTADPGWDGPSIDTVSLRLYQGRTLLGEASSGMFAELPLRSSNARYRLVMETERNADWWTMSTSTRTEWWFSSAPSDENATVGMLGVGYSLPLDGLNRAARSPIRMGLTVEDPTGTLTAPIERARVWTSTNDGRTWTEATTVRRTGDHTFNVRLPAASGPVSLKVVAFDEDGNRVSEEVIRAYNVR
jgi:subtilisin family serine protease